MILEEFESAMSAQWLDKVDLNSTLARVVVAGLIGVPSVYPGVPAAVSLLCYYQWLCAGTSPALERV